jgi:chemotaxis response regulator CheB
MEDMTLGSTVYFKNNTLQIKVANNGTENYSYLKVKGDLIVAVDPSTDEKFNGVWRFSKTDSNPIVLTGMSNGVYSDVFEISIVDLIQSEISTEIMTKQDNYDFVYSATSVLGRN